jgi:hypothetical protein
MRSVIDDPYENELRPPECVGVNVLWFGHAANIGSLIQVPHLTVCSNHPHAIPWTPQTERECLEDCAVVMLTGSNPGASTNRVVKALRAGRFVVTPGLDSWQQFRDYIWIGDVQEGIAWALNNREEACSKIAAGQQYSERFSPSVLGKQWGNLFASTLGRATPETPAG